MAICLRLVSDTSTSTIVQTLNILRGLEAPGKSSLKGLGHFHFALKVLKSMGNF